MLDIGIFRTSFRCAVVGTGGFSASSGMTTSPGLGAEIDKIAKIVTVVHYKNPRLHSAVVVDPRCTEKKQEAEYESVCKYLRCSMFFGRQS